MADPISVGSGLLTLVVFAFQSSKTLYQAFESIQNNARTVRELKEELHALTEVLKSLEETAKHTENRLSALKLPLFACGNACTDFAVVVAKCTAHSNGSKTSIRDWTRLNFKGKDIASFRSLIAGYKSTINIALGDANIRTAVVTADLLNEYKDMIKNTAADLEELLQAVDERMSSKVLRVRKNSADVLHSEDEGNSIQEKASIQQCLKICEEVSAHIDEVQARDLAPVSVLLSDQNKSIKVSGITTARVNTSKAFDACKRELGVTSSQLKMQLDDLNNRVAKLSEQENSFGENAANNQSMKEELESIKKCLEICTEATEQAARERVNVFEDVGTGDDGHQVIVATLGDLISAKRITVGARSTQWLGQMADASLQQLAQSHGKAAMEAAKDPISGAHFEGRHGTGRTLV